MTNSTAYLQQVLQINDQLLGLPALPLVFVGCLAVGYMSKAIPFLDNRWIPAVVLGFAVLAYLGMTPLSDAPSVFRAVVLGVIAGAAAWLVHNKFLSRWEKPAGGQEAKEKEKPDEK